MCHKRRHYTSDLKEDQWALICPLLPTDNKGPGRPIEIDMRQAVSGMLYIAKTGCQWKNLPHEFPNYQSVYYHYRKWCLDGTWERVNRALLYQTRRQVGRLPYPSAAIMDSQSVKTTEVGGERGFDSFKKVKGRKRHLLVDTAGHVLKAVVLPADLRDRDGARLLLAELMPMLRLRIDRIWADGAYKGAFRRWCWDHLRIALTIVVVPSSQFNFSHAPRRWVVERTFAWLGNYRRLSKDYEESTKSSEGMIYLASIHMMLNTLTT